MGRSKINTVLGALIISRPLYDFLAQVLERILVSISLAVGRILTVLGKKAVVAGPIRTKRLKSLSYGPFFWAVPITFTSHQLSNSIPGARWRASELTFAQKRNRRKKDGRKGLRRKHL